MTGTEVQSLAVCMAFWAALALYGPRARGCLRFALALGMGAVAAQLVGALSLREGGGSSLLWLPAGLLMVERSPRAFAALSLPIALARLGCLSVGCCGAQAIPPIPAIEAAFFVALHVLVRRVRPRAAPAVFLAAFGAIRLLVSPWRDFGDDRLFSIGAALTWIAVAGLLAVPLALRRGGAATLWRGCDASFSWRARWGSPSSGMRVAEACSQEDLACIRRVSG